jgi:Histidine kinase/Two component regulator propeller
LLKQCLFLILFFVLCFASSEAQKPVFRTINDLNGLPSNTVYDLIQDKSGFIWVAHDKGLSRYDGRSFVNFYSKSTKARGVSNLMQIGDDIWCQDFIGNHYQVFKNNDSLEKADQILETAIYRPTVNNGTDELVFIATDSFGVYNIKSKKTAFFLFHSRDENPISLKLNNKVVVYNNGIVESADGTVVDRFKPYEVEYLFYIVATGDKLFGFTRDKYPYVFEDLNINKPIHVLKPDLFIQSVVQVGTEIWVCTSTGAYCFDLDMRPLYGGFCFFDGVSISKVCKDNEGSYWFSTLNKGIYYVANLNIKLFNYEGAAMTAIAVNETKNQLVVGTDRNEVLAFNSDQSFIKKFAFGVNKEVTSMCFIDDGLFVCNQNLTFLDHDFKQKWSFATPVKDVAMYKSGQFFTAIPNGIAFHNTTQSSQFLPSWVITDADHTLNIKEVKSYHISTQSSRGRSVAYDEVNNILYASTSAGLFYYSDKKQGEIMLDNKSVFASQIHIVGKDVYAATFSSGLVKIENLKAVSFLTKEQGLYSNTVFKFYVDRNKFWLLEEGMLQSYDLKTKRFDDYSYNDGLPRAEIKGLVVYKDQVHIATNSGLVVFDKQLSTQNAVAPRLALTGYKVNGSKLVDLDQASLRPEQNNIDISFSVLSYRGEGALAVSYQINDNPWVPIANDLRILSLNALTSGSYTIRIKALNEDGVACIKPLELQFNIARVWYKRWYSLLLFASLAGLTLYLVYQRRIESIKSTNNLLAEKLKLEHEVQQSMLVSIKSQMNPHFLFNALNTIQSYIYTNDKEKAAMYLGKFSDLTRSILAMSNKETISLTEEIRTLQLYLDLEQLRFDDTLTYRFEVDFNIDTDSIQIPSMLIQPYVENAIKHGLLHKKDNRLLLLRFTSDTYNLHIQIDDNGIGRKKSALLNAQKSKKYDSFAINANQKRLDILNYGSKVNIVMRITDKINDNGEPTGTLVELSIPIIKS